MVVVALAALVVWVGLYAASPTRRLAARLASGFPAYARRDAAVALGGEGIPNWERRAAVRELVGALDDPNTQVRIGALLGLSGRGADALAALPRLIQLAGEPSPADLRFSAVGVMGDLVRWAGPTDRDAIWGALRGRLSDPSALVRVWAARGLLPLDEQPALVTLLHESSGPGDPMARTTAYHQLRAHAPRSAGFLPILRREARDPDPERRLRMLDLIVKLAPVDVVTAEVRRAATDPDEQVRRAAGRLETRAADAAETSPR